MYRRILITIFCASILLSFTACAGQNEIKLSGTVEYTQYDVNAEAAGKIVDVKMKEGSAVKAGDVIATVDSALQTLAVAQAEAAVMAKQIQLDELNAGAREEQLSAAEASVKAAQAKYTDVANGATTEEKAQAQAAADVAGDNEKTAKTAYEYVNSKYDEVLSAYNLGLATKAQLDEAKFNKDTAYSQYQAAADQHNAALAALKKVKKGASSAAKRAAKAGVEQAQAQLDLLQNGSTQYAIGMAQANLDAAQAQLSQAKLAQSKCSIVSPVSGMAAIVQISLGDMVNTGGYTATIIDENDIWTHVYMPQTGLRYVTLHQEVQVTTPAWPDATFAGTVVYIAEKAQFTPKNTETQDAKENTVFKIKIKIDDPDKKLKPGMTVYAHIPAGGQADGE
jgi:HlyD family secretion protein